jgi:hypothetical protein
LCCQHRSRAKRRANAGAPHCAKQQANAKLPRNPRYGKASEVLFRPIAHWTPCNCYPLLKRRHNQNKANQDQENRCSRSEQTHIDSNRKPNRCNEKSDRDERDRNTRR